MVQNKQSVNATQSGKPCQLQKCWSPHKKSHTLVVMPEVGVKPGQVLAAVEQPYWNVVLPCLRMTTTKPFIEALFV